MKPTHCGILLALTATPVSAQVALLPGHPGNPRLTHGSATAQQGAGGTTIFLQANSRIAWSDFSVPAGTTTRFQSQGAPGRASVNVVDGLSRSLINGQVIADGPFALLNSRGITVGGTGGISAPRVLLSGLAADNDLALLNGQSTRWTNSGGRGRIQIDGTVDANSGALVIMGPAITIGSQGRVRSANGQVQVIAADRVAVDGPDGSGRMTVAAGNGSGFLSTQGSIEAREVEIIADGFIRNGGKIVSSGASNRVRLAAPAIIHENRPGSLIQSSQLQTEGTFDQQGPVINPDDGSNPAGVSGIRQLPKLTLAPASLTDLRPSQLSFNPLQTVMLGTPVSEEGSDGTTLAVRRGAMTASATGESSTKEPPPKPKKKTLTSRKSSFFGQTVVGR